MQAETLSKTDRHTKQIPCGPRIHVVRDDIAQHQQCLYSFESSMRQKVGESQTFKAAADLRSVST